LMAMSARNTKDEHFDGKHKQANSVHHQEGKIGSRVSNVEQNLAFEHLVSGSQPSASSVQLVPCPYPFDLAHSALKVGGLVGRNFESLRIDESSPPFGFVAVATMLQLLALCTAVIAISYAIDRLFLYRLFRSPIRHLPVCLCRRDLCSQLILSLRALLCQAISGATCLKSSKPVRPSFSNCTSIDWFLVRPWRRAQGIRQRIRLGPSIPCLSRGRATLHHRSFGAQPHPLVQELRLSKT
jgi:hypothetical protein